MPRKKTSIVWTIDEKEFVAVISKAVSVADALRCFGLESKGNNHKTLKARMDFMGLNYKALADKGRQVSTCEAKKRACDAKKDLKDILIEGSTYNRYYLKQRLLGEGVLDNICSICGNSGVWLGAKLTLVLDHINGVSNDNRLENLRFLCPNCNSQTETFAGRNVRRTKIEEYTGVDQLEDQRPLKADVVGSNPTSGRTATIQECTCGTWFIKKPRNRKYCSAKCANKARRKTKRPDKETLVSLISRHNWCELGRMFGVSDNAVRKWAKSYGLPIKK